MKKYVLKTIFSCNILLNGLKFTYIHLRIYTSGVVHLSKTSFVFVNYLSILSIYFIYLFIRLFIYLFNYLFMYLFIYLFIHLSIYLFIILFIINVVYYYYY